MLLVSLLWLSRRRGSYDVEAGYGDADGYNLNFSGVGWGGNRWKNTFCRACAHILNATYIKFDAQQGEFLECVGQNADQDLEEALEAARWREQNGEEEEGGFTIFEKYAVSDNLNAIAPVEFLLHDFILLTLNELSAVEVSLFGAGGTA